MKFEYINEKWFLKYDDVVLQLKEERPSPPWEDLKRAALRAEHPVNPFKWPKRKRKRLTLAAKETVTK